ncbi:uncharacterized protein LOC124541358 [Vanessa cardui]|uniref:uncharacterized protein LOC124541358 n=1 Tax=Vanessa cardui TaxID=171605 RepID=UPI001F138128|nr:uncharacterized protein LOC124541358 [Vanessa cardui]
MSVGHMREFIVKSGNWLSYVERLEMYFMVNKVADDLKIPTLISVMGEEAYDLLAALRRQLQDESIAAYVTELKKLSRYCEFNATLDENLRDQLVYGLRSEVIRQRLFSEENIVYNRAIALALSLEAAERDASAVEDVARTEGINKIYLSECSKCGDNRHKATECRYKDYVCSGCHEIGHLRKMCPKKHESYRAQMFDSAETASSYRFMKSRGGYVNNTGRSRRGARGRGRRAFGQHGASSAGQKRAPGHLMSEQDDEYEDGELKDSSEQNMHKTLFDDTLGKYTGGQAELCIREGAQPIFCRARPLPYALRERVDSELDAMLRAGIIEPVEHSDWATPLVVLRKPDGELHDTHMGMVKTKALARSYVWWPRVDEAVEAECRACSVCAATADAPPAPYHPASNGAAENAVKTCKRVINKAFKQNLEVSVALNRFLLAYRNTEHPTTGDSPARILQGRNLRMRLDNLKPERASRVAKQQARSERAAGGAQRQLEAGALVWYREYKGVDKWIAGTIVEALGNSDYRIRSIFGTETHRHIDQIKIRVTKNQLNDISSKVVLDAVQYKNQGNKLSRKSLTASVTNGDNSNQTNNGVSNLEPPLYNNDRPSLSTNDISTTGPKEVSDSLIPAPVEESNVSEEREGPSPGSSRSSDRRVMRVRKPPVRYGFGEND